LRVALRITVGLGKIEFNQQEEEMNLLRKEMEELKLQNNKLAAELMLSELKLQNNKLAAELMLSNFFRALPVSYAQLMEKLATCNLNPTPENVIDGYRTTILNVSSLLPSSVPSRTTNGLDIKMSKFRRSMLHHSQKLNLYSISFSGVDNLVKKYVPNYLQIIDTYCPPLNSLRNLFYEHYSRNPRPVVEESEFQPLFTIYLHQISQAMDTRYEIQAAQRVPLEAEVAVNEEESNAALIAAVKGHTDIIVKQLADDSIITIFE
jgi:hypothetical protein